MHPRVRALLKWRLGSASVSPTRPSAQQVTVTLQATTQSVQCLQMTEPCFLFLAGFEFFETSAKDNVNVKQTFERLVDIICDKMSESLETEQAAAKQNTKLTEAPPPPQPSCGC